ncbi:Tripartite terminase subunit [Trichinella pseudospiralis]
MSVSVLAVIGVGVLRLLRNKRLTPPIMTCFDDVNKKEPKGATFGDGIISWLCSHLSNQNEIVSALDCACYLPKKRESSADPQEVG